MGSLYIIFYVGFEPHLARIRTRIETFNECVIMACCYHLFAWSAIELDPWFPFMMGFSFIALVVLITLVNLTVVIRIVISKIRL